MKMNIYIYIYNIHTCFNLYFLLLAPKTACFLRASAVKVLQAPDFPKGMEFEQPLRR